MKPITGESIVKRLVILRGKLLYAYERGGDHRLHAALNAFEASCLALNGAGVAFASENEASCVTDLWDEVHDLALRAFYATGGRRKVYGLTVPPPAPPQFGPSPFPIAHV
ncbi:hypothetical protein V5F32_06085 [Xanthobacter oligotrophicus]|uniref:Uncharacterized protein n=1 Tax=Xanthobacter oligotrophicus TaxID=2607286 RepID=A0ABW6ZTG8_9HYPH